MKKLISKLNNTRKNMQVKMYILPLKVGLYAYMGVPFIKPALKAGGRGIVRLAEAHDKARKAARRNIGNALVFVVDNATKKNAIKAGKVVVMVCVELGLAVIESSRRQYTDDSLKRAGVGSFGRAVCGGVQQIEYNRRTRERLALYGEILKK